MGARLFGYFGSVWTSGWAFDFTVRLAGSNIFEISLNVVARTSSFDGARYVVTDGAPISAVWHDWLAIDLETIGPALFCFKLTWIKNNKKTRQLLGIFAETQADPGAPAARGVGSMGPGREQSHVGRLDFFGPERGSGYFHHSSKRLARWRTRLKYPRDLKQV